MNSVREKSYKNKGNLPVLNRMPETARTVLDVGCGAGDNARLLKERGLVIDGITLSEEEAAASREFCRQVWIFNLEDGLPPEVTDRYDAVICSHVLEHVCW
ncbi:MAG: class I SAM-dependent methyltransferase, partial [Elainellaceae cyanobacterium]